VSADTTASDYFAEKQSSTLAMFAVPLAQEFVDPRGNREIHLNNRATGNF